jgi:SAM-dependent methyltransferase
VLDVDCGTGADLIAIAERLPPGSRATGIDVSASVIAEARRRASSLDLTICFDCGNAANLQYEDASFAACRAATVLQHVPDASQVIREMIRVTCPGGRVAALEFDQDSTMLDHPDRDTTRVIVQTFGDAMANGWIGRQLPRLFRQAGSCGWPRQPSRCRARMGPWSRSGPWHSTSARWPASPSGSSPATSWAGTRPEVRDGPPLVIRPAAATAAARGLG